MWTIGILILLALYFLPTMVALSRHHKDLTAILIINGFLGWSLVGWVVALVWAVKHQE
jgi:hypothetical protein